MKKIIVTIFFFATAINCSAQFYDFSAVCSTGQTLYYTITSDSTVAIVAPSYSNGAAWGSFTKPTGRLVIPDTVLSYKITQISHSAFRDCDGITSIEVGGSISVIGVFAFYGCSGIDSVFLIGQNISFVGNNAFAGCGNIKYFFYNIPHCTWGVYSSTPTYDGPFFNSGATNVEFVVGDSVNHLPFRRASDLPSIRSLYIGNNVDSIPSIMVGGSLRTIYIGRSVTYLPNNFTYSLYIKNIYYNAKNCSQASFSSINNNLHKTIIIGDDVEAIPPNAFRGLSNIDSIYIGCKVLSIGDNAFQGCTGVGLKTISISNSVSHVGTNAFYGCTDMDSLNIGSGVQYIGDSAFYGCENVKYIFYNAQNCTSALFDLSHTSPFANTNTNQLTTLIIGDSVKAISAFTFRNRISINNITLPHGLTSIGNGAFLGCNSIQMLVIPNSVSFIGNGAFAGCSGIDSLCISTGIITIGDSVFSGCSSILNVVVPDGVTSIGEKAFSGCTSIQHLYLPNSLTSLGNSAFFDCSGIRHLNIPDGLISIGDNAFYGCTNIDSLYIGNNIQTIGGGAFRGCTGLTWLNYNAPLLPIQGFYGCTKLATLILGDNVQSIGSESFYNCDSLTSLVCNVNQIGASAFADCDNLLSVTTNAHSIGSNAFADCDRLVTVTLGDSVQTIGSGAFSGDFRLQTVTLGDNITSIGDSAFRGCVRLERPELPANLQTIGTRAFNGCSLLNGKLTFPPAVSSIGDYAFSGIGSVTEIEMKGSTPPTIYAHTFASISTSTPVSVPCGAVLSYYTTDYWENFSNIVEAPPYSLTVASNNEVMGSATVTQQPTCSNHSAIIQATALAGYHFLQWNDSNNANPRTLQMTQDSAFTAIFVQNNSYITVHSNDSTMGSVTGTGLYSYNAPVTLTATAYGGYHFLRWDDGNTQNPRYMAAVRDTSFTAIFVSNVSTITVANANPEMGNVSGSGVYYYQNLVTITATPVYGHHFAQWNDGNQQNPRTVTVVQDSSFTAYFALNTYSIVASSNSTTMGSVSGGGSYTYLHEMSLTAAPAYGYHFVQWNDQVTDNPRTITVTRDSVFTAQFAANSYSITAEANDPTMGSVYGSGTYNYNATATLTAVETYGYHFTQWSDGVTDNPRTVTVLNSATYTAQFEINSYILTVQSSNPAIGTTSGGGSYNYLTPVNITALPNDGYHFTQWSDGNTDNPRLVSVTANATYTAQFAINSYAVGVTSNNSNMGSVSGSGTYNHNATATLTATAYYGYHFVQWQDGNTQNPRTVTVTDSAQYTAEFAYNSYLVTANSSSVTLGSATGGGSYNYLSQVALTAVPVQHYHFTLWNDSIDDNPRTITVTRDTVFTAHFAIDRHTIGVLSANAVQGATTGSDTVDYNTAVWITATANYGYHFTQWNDGNTQNPRRVVVTQDTVFTATFASNQYSATCTVNDDTRGTVANAGGSYSYLTQLTFTAIPTADYHFLRWSNGSTDNPITITLTKDTTLTAILVGLTANSNDTVMGMASHSKLSNLVEMVTATANYGYHFVQWNDAGTTATSTDNPRTMALSGDTTVTAIFAINSYSLSVGSNDSTLGSVQGGGMYDYLSQATIAATAAPHSHFVQWNDGNTSNPRLLTLTSDTAFTALFEQDQQYQITVCANDTSRGSVEGGGTYYIGERVTIAATANEHYYFAYWSDGITSNPRVVTVTGDATYTAVFEPVMYTLTVEANDYAMGQVTGGGSYAYGSVVSIEARAFGGYRFTGWDDGVQDEQRSVTITADASYMALFEPNVGIGSVEETTYKIYVSDGRIIVEGAESSRVQLFDITGRRHKLSEQLPAGVYLIRIGNRYTKKVVVL